MSDFNSLNRNECYPSACGKFYMYREELYTKQFPKEWLQHKPGTGPHDCGNCKASGFWNGVFIGYCANCAAYMYQFKRGYGFIYVGRETEPSVLNTVDDDGNEFVVEKDNSVRAFDTYLKDVSLCDIGDDELFDSSVEYEQDKEDREFMQRMREQNLVDDKKDRMTELLQIQRSNACDSFDDYSDCDYDDHNDP